MLSLLAGLKWEIKDSKNLDPVSTLSPSLPPFEVTTKDNKTGLRIFKTTLLIMNLNVL